MQSTLLDPPKEKTRTYHATMLSTAMSPITHMMGVEGNEAIVMREPVNSGGDLRWVPVLSGNALRHRMIRAPGVRYLIDRWELRGKLTLAQLNLLFHGGNLSQSNASVSLERTNRLYRLFPLFRVVGCSLADQIMPSNMDCHRGILVCSENQERINSLLPADLPRIKGLRPAACFVEGYQYTRNDATTTAADCLPDESNEESSSNMMIFSGQSVIAGAAFLHGFLLRHVNMVELGAALWSLRLWQSEGATIGGMASKGHGRLNVHLHLKEEVNQEDAIERYRQHVEDVRHEATEFLHSLFDAGNGKPKRKKKGGGDA